MAGWGWRSCVRCACCAQSVPSVWLVLFESPVSPGRAVLSERMTSRRWIGYTASGVFLLACPRALFFPLYCSRKSSSSSTCLYFILMDLKATLRISAVESNSCSAVTSLWPPVSFSGCDRTVVTSGWLRKLGGCARGHGCAAVVTHRCSSSPPCYGQTGRAWRSTLMLSSFGNPQLISHLLKFRLARDEISRYQGAQCSLNPV